MHKLYARRLFVLEDIVDHAEKAVYLRKVGSDPGRGINGQDIDIPHPSSRVRIQVVSSCA